MKAPRYDRMRRIYSLYTNDELDCAAKEFDGLTGEARNALQYELRQRGLESQDTSAKPIQAAERLALDSEQPRTSGSNWLWPVVTNEEEAKKAAKRGAYAATLVAVLTAAVALIAIGAKGPIMGMDGWAMLDALLFALIAWKIFKLSFPWAIVGLLLYLAEVSWRWSKVGIPNGGGVVIQGLIIMALITSVRGTLFLSKDRKSKTKEISAKGAVDDSVDSSLPSGRSRSIDLPTESRVADLYQAWQQGGKEGLRKAYQPEDER